MCEIADRQCHNTMIQKHLEFGEMESFAHIVHKVEDLLQKGEDSKTGKGNHVDLGTYCFVFYNCEN